MVAKFLLDSSIPLFSLNFAALKVARKALFLLTKSGLARPPARKSLILQKKTGLSTR